jgi:hypothetical protein
MKSLDGFHPRATRAESELEEAVGGLFRRLRGLNGFTVMDAGSMAKDREAGQLEGDLSLADITTEPGYAYDYFGDIAIALIDLLEERPEARELLRGRTFARTLH